MDENEKNHDSTSAESSSTPDGSTNISEEQKARTAELSDGTGNDNPDADDNSDTASGGTPE